MATSVDTSRRTSLDQHLSKGMDLLTMGLENRGDEISFFAAQYDINKFYPHFVDALYKSMVAVLNMDRDEMDLTVQSLKELIKIVDKLRNKSWSSWIVEPNYEEFTDKQCHAELVYADSQICSACNIILADATFTAFINAAICVRSAYSSYKTCLRILESKSNWTSDYCRMHFESGTRTAMGLFDLMISFLPSQFVKLLEYTGFSGNRVEGLRQLSRAIDLEGGSRWPIAAMAVGAHHTFFEYVYGLGESDLQVVEQIASKSASMYPNVSCLSMLPHFNHSKPVFSSSFFSFSVGTSSSFFSLLAWNALLSSSELLLHDCSVSTLQ